MWVIWPATPAFWIAATESPPPTTDSADEAATARATASVPPANGSDSNTPIGPFQKIVLARAIAVAGQDCHWEAKGAFTGEVAPAQLVDAGCRYVIVGHSERRQLMGERDADVSRKARAALGAGLAPIVCVGETLAERDVGSTLNVVGAQLAVAVGEMASADARRLLVAYEPVWAIGTGRTATPAQAEEVHRFIRDRLSERFPTVAAAISLLYGGSVKPDNIRALMAEPNIDGALVGGASLSAESFIRLVKEGADVWSHS